LLCGPWSAGTIPPCGIAASVPLPSLHVRNREFAQVEEHPEGTGFRTAGAWRRADARKAKGPQTCTTGLRYLAILIALAGFIRENSTGGRNN